MNRRNLSALVLSACLLLLACPTFSQTVTVSPPGFADGRTNRPSGLRVQTQINLFLPGSVLGNLQEQETASEKARSALYEVAGQECEVLTKVFKAQCKLASVNVTSNIQTRFQGAGNEGVMANGTFVYDLTDYSK